MRAHVVLNLKGFDYEIVPVNLAQGAQADEPFVALNPSKGVPVLVLDDGAALSQSLTIINYLDFLRPEPGILGVDPEVRARELEAAMLSRWIST